MSTCFVNSEPKVWNYRLLCLPLQLKEIPNGVGYGKSFCKFLLADDAVIRLVVRCHAVFAFSTGAVADGG